MPAPGRLAVLVRYGAPWIPRGGRLLDYGLRGRLLISAHWFRLGPIVAPWAPLLSSSDPFHYVGFVGALDYFMGPSEPTLDPILDPLEVQGFPAVGPLRGPPRISSIESLFSSW